MSFVVVETVGAADTTVHQGVTGSCFVEVYLAHWFVVGQVCGEVVVWLKPLLVAICQCNSWPKQLQIKLHKASSLLLHSWTLEGALRECIIVTILHGIVSTISINTIIMISNSVQVARSNFNRAIKLFLRLYCFEVTFLVIFIELGFKIDLAIKKTFHAFWLFDVHRTRGITR